jgi:hypothetical protein
LRLGFEADFSPPPAADVKNVWSCIFIPPCSFQAWCLIDVLLIIFILFHLHVGLLIGPSLHVQLKLYVYFIAVLPCNDRLK